MKRLGAFLGVVLSAVAQLGCSGLQTSAGEFGATQGGVQDLTFARGVVENGQVPPPEAFVVEAMFSEHDLPLTGAPCSTLFCLRSAMGIAPNAAGTSAAWVQVGMSATIDPATFERPSLAVVATVDVSGSMGWDYGDGGGSTPAAVAHALLWNVASRLNGADRFSLVTYGSSVDIELDWTKGDDPAIKAAIGGLDEAGSTNMEEGMKLAYELAREAKGTADEVRVMLFTDAQPNVGVTSGGEFEAMVASGASEGIGITVFGVGLGLNAELVNRMSHLRGANAFSALDANDVGLFMQDNWPWLAVPIAHNLKLSVAPSPGLTLEHAYGFPTGEAGATEAASLEVASVFLSKRKGALLLELSPESDQQLAGSSVDIDLSYSDRSGEAVTESLSASYSGEPLDERGVFMPQPSVGKTVALALLVQAMHDAAEKYAASHEEAIAILEPALDRFKADAAAIGDEGLAEEAAFWVKLLDLMKSGAPQGSFYGGADGI